MLRRMRATLAACCAIATLAYPFDAPADAAFAPEIAAFSPPSEPFEHGLLWRIEKPGVPVSYVFGTMHANDARVVGAIPDVDAALANCRTFAMEAVINEVDAQSFLEAAQLRGGRRLETLLDATTFDQVQTALAERGIDQHIAARVKPWAAWLYLSLDKAGGDEPTVDQRLFARARARRMRIIGLEMAEEQTAVFDSLPLATQIALLKHLLAYREEYVAMRTPAIEAWLARDLARLALLNGTLGERFPEMREHFAVLTKVVIDDRNAQFAYRLFLPLRQGKTFVAVGALHLYGRKGLLQLLQEQGYQLTPVY